MSDDDIVAELDRWLFTHGPGQTGLLQRAREEIAKLRTMCAVADQESKDYSDEIVALRMKVDLLENRDDILRAAVLEEAARECEALGDKPHQDTAAQCARAIRALKDDTPKT
jgi:hypothetical protein